jgi:hypothetical protein
MPPLPGRDLLNDGTRQNGARSPVLMRVMRMSATGTDDRMPKWIIAGLEKIEEPKQI